MNWPIKDFQGYSLGSNIYVVFSQAGPIVIDAGSTEDTAFKQAISYLRKSLKSITNKKIHLFLTHAHHRHAGAVNQFRKKLSSVKILAHADTATQLEDPSLAAGPPSGSPVLCDYVIRGFEKFDFGNFSLSAYPSTGHCEGHLSYLLHNFDDTISTYGQNYLFTGDLLFEYGISYSMGDSDVSKLIHSLRRASDLGFLVAFPGHGSVLYRRQFVVTAALALIDLITREEKVLSYLTAPRSTEEICHYVFDWLWRTGESLQSCMTMTLHHLLKLQIEKRVQNEQSRWISR